MHLPHFRDRLSQWRTPGHPLLPTRNAVKGILIHVFLWTCVHLHPRMRFLGHWYVIVIVAEQWLIAPQKGCNHLLTTNQEWMLLCLRVLANICHSLSIWLLADVKLCPEVLFCISLLAKELEPLLLISLLGFIFTNFLFSFFAHFSIGFAFFWLIWF